MRRLLSILGPLFSLLLAIAGVYILFSIPGIGALLAGILVTMLGFAACGMVLERTLKLINSSRVAMIRSSRQEIDLAEPVAAQQPIAVSE